MAGSLAAVVLLVCCNLLVQGQSSLPLEVIQLRDDNFEHDTQAASGQTTGIW